MSAVQFPDYRKAPKQMEDNDSTLHLQKKKKKLKVTLSFKVRVIFSSSPSLPAIHKKSTSLLKRKAQLIFAGHMQFDCKGQGSH